MIKHHAVLCATNMDQKRLRTDRKLVARANFYSRRVLNAVGISWLCLLLMCFEASKASAAHLLSSSDSSLDDFYSDTPWEEVLKHFVESDDQEQALVGPKDILSANTPSRPADSARSRAMLRRDRFSDLNTPPPAKRQRIHYTPQMLEEAVQRNDVAQTGKILDYLFEEKVPLDKEKLVKLANQHPDSKMTALLDAHGIKLELVSHKPRDQLLFDAVHSHDHDLILKLVNSGANVNAVNSIGFTPMSTAAFTGDSKAMYILLKAGADPRLGFRDQGYFGLTMDPLEIAIREENLELTSLLIYKDQIPLKDEHFELGRHTKDTGISTFLSHIKNFLTLSDEKAKRMIAQRVIDCVGPDMVLLYLLKSKNDLLVGEFKQDLAKLARFNGNPYLRTVSQRFGIALPPVVSILEIPAIKKKYTQ